MLTEEERTDKGAKLLPKKKKQKKNKKVDKKEKLESLKQELDVVSTVTNLPEMLFSCFQNIMCFVACRIGIELLLKNYATDLVLTQRR